MRVRLATSADAEAIATIYNQGIEDRVATFETRLRTPEEIIGWFDGSIRLSWLSKKMKSLPLPPALPIERGNATLA